ncbi:hypothetical protein AFE02nite_22700 [Actinotalea fermentans]|uniref:Uncharacterized protein n=1 Tax=Actinotalea fermentans TaxID=43671 RepID=A0A511YZJ3_9CELL|nr:hypothetical protein AFE02nite_22700 [Actinotalea fermentans]
MAEGRRRPPQVERPGHANDDPLAAGARARHPRVPTHPPILTRPPAQPVRGPTTPWKVPRGKRGEPSTSRPARTPTPVLRRIRRGKHDGSSARPRERTDGVGGGGNTRRPTQVTIR